MSTINKQYERKKAYIYDSKRMKKKGYYPETIKVCNKALCVEYKLTSPRKKGMSEEMNEVKKQIIARLDQEMISIGSGNVTGKSIGIATGLGIALEIVESYIEKNK